MPGRIGRVLSAGWTLSPVGDGPVIDGWQTEMSGWGVFYARRSPDHVLAEHEVLAGLTRYLVAHTAEELIRLADEQRRLQEQLSGGTQPVVCPHCGRAAGEAPLIVTIDESSVTAERCAQSYRDGAACAHDDVEWTHQDPLPEGARCRECGTWWRLDLIPAAVAARLTGGIAAPEDSLPPVADRKHP
ncbi:hypothetical protein AB0M44_39435 [Streptosporangium subroseum]|uniref:hypothetical protein n=1 Tax=Streptosporangium subroseum TaxID=106412 RepID=UPI00342993AE